MQSRHITIGMAPFGIRDVRSAGVTQMPRLVEKIRAEVGDAVKDLATNAEMRARFLPTYPDGKSVLMGMVSQVLDDADQYTAIPVAARILAIYVANVGMALGSGMAVYTYYHPEPHLATPDTPHVRPEIRESVHMYETTLCNAFHFLLEDRNKETVAWGNAAMEHRNLSEIVNGISPKDTSQLRADLQEAFEKGLFLGAFQGAVILSATASPVPSRTPGASVR